MKQELGILLPGAQALTAFLIILPFQGEFAQIGRAEKWVHLVTFLCSIRSLVFFNVPAAQYRLDHSLCNPTDFKQGVNRLIISRGCSRSPSRSPR